MQEQSVFFVITMRRNWIYVRIVWNTQMCPGRKVCIFVRIVGHTKVLRDEFRNFCENHKRYGNKSFK
jgi:hypothetical protein